MPSGELLLKAFRSLRWLPALTWQELSHSLWPLHPSHILIALADHFEPARLVERPGDTAPVDEQERIVERWCSIYPKVFDAWRDGDGQPFRHTYFYPAEQYVQAPVERLAQHCQDGWGEIEIHLHHGVGTPDTADNTRRALIEHRDILAGHGCLSRWNGEGGPRYAFVHGNWALANSSGGHFCGVDEEMSILAETGCYADLTLPSAPDRSQIGKINALYECGAGLNKPIPHRRGQNLRRGSTPTKFPLIIQGPLALSFRRRILVPTIENGAITSNRPATMERFRVWNRAAISVEGQPDWVFIKLYCHGIKPVDEPAMLGDLMGRFLRELSEWAELHGVCIHFVTAREMVNIILAACDGRVGNPGAYRDYRLVPIAMRRR
jgi:hypothetical protein